MTTAPKIGAAQMLLLGLGWFGMLFFWGFYSGAMPLFLANFTDSKFQISLVLSLAGFSGSVVPPIVGYLSDRATTRFGRRTPYVFFGILGTALCVAALPLLTPPRPPTFLCFPILRHPISAALQAGL
ncbi:MAG: MFS transporter [Candidatus Lindowbacteria bacterium]|nr:MFS transporter [Candidatus Lindowbacteria bacterium]